MSEQVAAARPAAPDPFWLRSADLRRRLLQALLLEPSKISFADFLNQVDEDTLAEWVNGEIVMASPASYQRQAIAGFLANVTSLYVQTRGLGIVCSAPFLMKLENAREPDVLFVSQQHLNRLQPTFLDGPADLVVEIVSPESAGRDRGEKFYEYAQGGVPEYWLLDPQNQWAEFYQLQENHYYPAFSGKQGKYESRALPGFWLSVEWLWQEPLPTPIRALAEIVGMDAALLQAFERALKGQ